MGNDTPIRRINTVADTLKKTGVVAAYFVLAVIVFAAAWFEFKPRQEGYDLVVRSRFVTHTYYGVYYKEDFEIWEIKKGEDGSSQTAQIYPR